MPHRRRAPHNPRCPVHVTFRAATGLGSLREAAVFAGLVRAFAAASNDVFRLLQFSVQSDHLHLLVESDTPTRLTRGVQASRYGPQRPPTACTGDTDAYGPTDFTRMC